MPPRIRHELGERGCAPMRQEAARHLVGGVEHDTTEAGCRERRDCGEVWPLVGHQHGDQRNSPASHRCERLREPDMIGAGEEAHYDGRGIGLSAHYAGEFTEDTRQRDSDAVLNAVGAEQAVLLGSSEGGWTAATYAIQHPERITHLILYGAYVAARKRDRDLTTRKTVHS